MVKRLLAFTILSAMVIHCSSRLGLLDHLYQQRHEIACALGILSEKPIAMCNSSYDFGKSTTLQMNDERSAAKHLNRASEINLYIPLKPHYSFAPSITCVDSPLGNYSSIHYNSYLSDVFHPPCVQMLVCQLGA